MAKSMDNSVYDAALGILKNNVNLEVACSAQPTTYAEAFTTYKLASVAISAADVTIANGDVSGRKATIAAKTGVAVITGGTATHIALIDTTTSTLRLVTTCPSQALAGSGTVDIGSWKEEIASPT